VSVSKRKLDQYKGSLSPDQLAAGMNAANANARRLADDAERLLDAKRYPTAASLATLSVEESGKASILRELALARNEAECTEAWRSFRSHTMKNVAWLLPQLVASGARNLEDLRPLYDRDSDHPFVLDQIKQLGFYTDCLGDAHWSSPEDVIDESLARMLVRVAGVLARDRTVTTEEIELWQKHLGPVWKGPLEWMKNALAKWHEELVRRGLAEGDAQDMGRFIWPHEEQAVQQSGAADERSDA
jgi:AbiV family abortive infection protein